MGPINACGGAPSVFGRRQVNFSDHRDDNTNVESMAGRLRPRQGYYSGFLHLRMEKKKKRNFFYPDAGRLPAEPGARSLGEPRLAELCECRPANVPTSAAVFAAFCIRGVSGMYQQTGALLAFCAGSVQGGRPC